MTAQHVTRFNVVGTDDVHVRQKCSPRHVVLDFAESITTLALGKRLTAKEIRIVIIRKISSLTSTTVFIHLFTTLQYKNEFT
jgi:hypothetical protein